MLNFEPIPFRIRIGVAGHREVDDPAALEALVKQAIDSAIPRLFSPDSRAMLDRARAAGATPISYRVLSALAEGADRVVARAVLDNPGTRLDAVLPLAAGDYLKDFASEESKREFRELLALSRHPVWLRARCIAEESCDPGTQAGLRRNAYKAAGEYVVDHSDVLIAVWNGEPARGRGGTAEIVEYALQQGRPVIRLWQGAHALLNAETSNGLDASALEGIDRFNRQPIAPAQRAAYVRNMDHDLFEKPSSAAAIPAAARDLVDRCLLPFYAQASMVAKADRDTFHRAGRNIYVFSAAAVGCAAIGVLFPRLAAPGFATELALLVVIGIALWRARRIHAHQAWIEHRFLVERIRCAIFMAICGVEPQPIEVLPYMGHSQTVNDWMVRVYDEIWDRLPALPGCSAGQCAALNAYVREAWIRDQIEFHRNKERREGQRRRWLARAGAVVLPVTVAAAALHLLLLAWEPGAGTAQALRTAHTALHLGLAFIALLFPAIAASLAGMEAHREHLRLEKRSANMAPQLERLHRQMASATDPARFRSLLEQLDEIMLRETQDWLMLMRYVEIKAS